MSQEVVLSGLCAGITAAVTEIQPTAHAGEASPWWLTVYPRFAHFTKIHNYVNSMQLAFCNNISGILIQMYYNILPLYLDIWIFFPLMEHQGYFHYKYYGFYDFIIIQIHRNLRFRK